MEKQWQAQTSRYVRLFLKCVLLVGLTSPSCSFPFEDLTDAEDSLMSDTEDNIGIHICLFPPLL